MKAKDIFTFQNMILAAFAFIFIREELQKCIYMGILHEIQKYLFVGIKKILIRIQMNLKGLYPKRNLDLTAENPHRKYFFL